MGGYLARCAFFTGKGGTSDSEDFHHARRRNRQGFAAPPSSRRARFPLRGYQVCRSVRGTRHGACGSRYGGRDDGGEPMSLKDAIERNRARQAEKAAAAADASWRAIADAHSIWAAEDRATVLESVSRVALVLAMPEMECLIAKAEAALARDAVDYDVTGEAHDYVRIFVRCYRDALRAAADVQETIGEVSR